MAAVETQDLFRATLTVLKTTTIDKMEKDGKDIFVLATLSCIVRLLICSSARHIN
jgi:hypothetical protein